MVKKWFDFLDARLELVIFFVLLIPIAGFGYWVFGGEAALKIPPESHDMGNNVICYTYRTGIDCLQVER